MTHHLFCNTAITLDGKIGLPDRQKLSLGSREDWRRMSVLRSQADAVTVGGGTYRAFPEGYVERADRLSAPTSRPRPIWNVVVTRNFDLPLDAPAFKDPRLRMLVIGPESAPPERVAELSRRCEIVRLGAVTPANIVQALTERGATELLLEAGGGLTGQFLAAGLVDELYVTLVPRIIAGVGAPTLAEGDLFPFEQAPRLELLSHDVVGDELFLHYRVRRGEASEAPSQSG